MAAKLVNILCPNVRICFKFSFHQMETLSAATEPNWNNR
jgi:hypothetical protein